MKEAVKLNIRWVASHPNENKDDAVAAFKWALSFLGAELPADGFDQALIFHQGDVIEVDFNELGFNKTAIEALRDLISLMKRSGEYVKTGGIDLGRFIVLTLNSSHHYYAITGAKSRLSDFLTSHDFSMEKVAILESGVSYGDRLIRIPSGTDISKLAFLSSEGHGSLRDNSFETEEYEVVDIMPNGQNRFAIYDKNGLLMTAGDEKLGISGKPAKCLWCHETFIQPSFIGTSEVPGFIPPIQFNKLVSTWNKGLDSLRENLETALDFSKQHEHQLMEITYIGFMEPSIDRLSLEWQLSKDSVQSLLVGMASHIHPEFSFLGPRYHRKDIEQFSPYLALPVPDNAREFSIFEPKYISP